MFKVLTKHLFGKTKSPSDGEMIVDGRIIDQSTGEPVPPKGKLSESNSGVTAAGESVSGPKPKDATVGESLPKPGAKSKQTPDATNLGKPEQAFQASEPSGEDPEEDSDAPPEPGSEPRFQGDDIPEGYQIFLGAAGKSGRTISEYCYDLKWWNEKKRIQWTTWRDIERTINQMHASTARRKIAVLRSYARWLLREGYTRLHGEVGRVIPPKVPGRVPKDRGSKNFEDLRILRI